MCGNVNKFIRVQVFYKKTKTILFIIINIIIIIYITSLRTNCATNKATHTHTRVTSVYSSSLRGTLASATSKALLACRWALTIYSCEASTKRGARRHAEKRVSLDASEQYGASSSSSPRGAGRLAHAASRTQAQRIGLVRELHTHFVHGASGGGGIRDGKLALSSQLVALCVVHRSSCRRQIEAQILADGWRRVFAIQRIEPAVSQSVSRLR